MKTTEEILKEPFRLTQKLNALKIRLAEFQRLASASTGPTYGKEIVDKTRNLEAPFIKWIDKIMETEKKIAKVEKDLNAVKKQILEAVEKLDNEDYKNIIIMRYLNFYTWPDICKKLYISYSTCKRWNRNATKSVRL